MGGLIIRDLGKDGGFVIAPVHNVQDDVPAQNIVTMCEAALAFDVATLTRSNREENGND